MTPLGAPVSGIGWDDRLRGRIIGCAGSFDWLPLRRNGY